MEEFNLQMHLLLFSWPDYIFSSFQVVIQTPFTHSPRVSFYRYAPAFSSVPVFLFFSNGQNISS